MTLPDLVTTEELAALLNIHKETARRLLRQQRVPGGVRIGKRWYVRREALQTWLSQLEHVPLPTPAEPSLPRVLPELEDAAAAAVGISWFRERMLLAAIVDCSDDTIFSKTLDGIILSWNAGAERMYGYRAEEMVGKSVSMLVPPDQVDDVPMLLARVQRGEPVDHYETRRRRKDGQILNVSLSISPVRDYTGEIIAAATIARDITERKMTEARLRQGEEQWHSILSNMPVMLVATDHNQNLLVWNAECERVTGYQAEELLGSNRMMELLCPDEAYRQQKLQEWAQLRGNYRDWEITFTCKDGSTRHILWSSISKQFPVKGWASWAVGIDVTPRKRAQDQLRKQAQERERLYEMEQVARKEAEKNADWLARLQSVTAALVEALSSQQIGEIVVTQGAAILGATTGAFHRLVDGGATFEIDYWYNSKLPEAMRQQWQRYAADPGYPITHAIRTGQPLWFQNAEELIHDYPAMAELARNYPGATVALPLMVNRRALGAFTFTFENPRSFSDDERRWMVALAHQGAQALERVRLIEEAKEKVALEERQRLARELHDAVSQTLFASTTVAEAIPSLWQRNPERGAEQLGQVVRLNRLAMSEMRTLLLELRPENIANTQLSDLCRHLTETLKGRKDIDAECTVEGEEITLPAKAHLALYRIAQESIHNIVKHSYAKRVTVTIVYQPNKGVSLRVVDNGRGFDTERVTGGMGLGSMRERATAIGAAITLTSRLQEGTTVEVVWVPKDDRQ